MSNIILTASLSAHPTDGHATVTVSTGSTSAFVAGHRYWFDVDLLTITGAHVRVVTPSIWTATTAAATSSASLTCTVNDAEGGKVSQRQDISWPVGASGTIALTAISDDGDVYNLTGAVLTMTIRTTDASVLPPPASTRDYMDDLKTTLQGYMPDLVVIGPNDDGGQIRPPTIAWRPGNGTGADAGGARLGKVGAPTCLWIRELDIKFECFGGDVGNPDYGMTPTEGLINLLINCLQERFTKNGYVFKGEEWDASGRTGRGLACEVTVTIRVPLVRLDNPTVTIEHMTPTVEIDS
jgi:hypothetical protein